MTKKNIILLYISEISGHRSAAVAIEKSLKLLSHNADILNLNGFRYTNPISEKIVNRIYSAVIKNTPKIWDYMYDNPKVKKKLDKIKNSIHKMNSPKLKKLFAGFSPNAVVCTQAFPCGMVADYKKTYNSNLPLIAVLTDFVPHSYWIYDTVDYYIVPSEEVAEKLAKKGVPSHKIKPFGIPFNPDFNAAVDKEKIKHKLNLDPKVKTILIMGGGQGLGPIKTIVKSLERVKEPIQELIVTGTNRKLYHSLKKKIRKYKKKIQLFGYANNVNELMVASDIVITKPGGITTSEALAKRLPILILKPLPGQEMNNCTYLVQQKAGIRIDKPQKIHYIIDELIANPDKLDSLSQAAGRISKPEASLDIARFVLNLH
ncbi:MAG: glycosyltransferase [Candidatus Omnitrophica bacterium]|nr:glycosyltransferase [Candidatus Omnitrophota bacterium]